MLVSELLKLVNPLMTDGNKKVTHTLKKPCKAERSAAGLLKHMWPFCYYEALKSHSMLHRFKFYLRSSITHELWSSCLSFTTYKEEVDKLKLVEIAKPFCFESEYHSSI